MSELLTMAFLLQGLRISVPYVLCALGGTLSERSGVVNLSLEGMLLAGAFTATCGASVAGAGLGVLAGVAGGLATAALYAACVLGWRADQVVAGVAVNLLALGLTRFFLKLVFHSASSSPAVPGLEGWGVELFLAGAALAAVGVHAFLGRTAAGLRVRAVGEHPEAAHSLGVRVLRVRLAAVLASGVFAGLAGTWLALDNRGFVDRMSGGRGYIALAAMILGKWHPLGAAAACLMFGFADALQLQLQTYATGVPRELVQLLPYVLTLVTLAGVIGRTRAPAALGRPWVAR